jgi:hypothetical protein
MVIVKRLTESGIAEFRAWLFSGAPDPAPLELLTSESSSAPTTYEAYVTPGEFESRLGFGKYLNEVFRGAPLSEIRFDVGLWDWLSLFFVDQICPKLADNKRDAKEIVRYSLELKNRKWSRHVARMSWMTVHDHGEFSRVLLNLPLTKQSELLEQLAGAQETYGARSVIAMADRLYWDLTANGLRRGAQGKRGGTPRRLRTFMKQLRRTYDPACMSMEQLLGFLPREFERWLKEDGRLALPSQKFPTATDPDVRHRTQVDSDLPT